MINSDCYMEYLGEAQVVYITNNVRTTELVSGYIHLDLQRIRFAKK